MKNLISKLVVLSDNLDRLGLKKDADKIDQIISCAARGEGFDVLQLFDEPVELEDVEEDGPGSRSMLPDDDLEGLTTVEPEDAPIERKKDLTAPLSRVDEIKRRHEFLKRKKLEEILKDRHEEPVLDELELPVASPKDLEVFEDEAGSHDDENDADDDSLLDELKHKLKDVPDLAKQLLQLVKDNPELLDLLAL